MSSSYSEEIDTSAHGSGAFLIFGNRKAGSSVLLDRLGKTYEFEANTTKRRAVPGQTTATIEGRDASGPLKLSFWKKPSQSSLSSWIADAILNELEPRRNSAPRNLELFRERSLSPCAPPPTEVAGLIWVFDCNPLFERIPEVTEICTTSKNQRPNDWKELASHLILSEFKSAILTEVAAVKSQIATMRTISWFAGLPLLIILNQRQLGDFPCGDLSQSPFLDVVKEAALMTAADSSFRTLLGACDPSAKMTMVKCQLGNELSKASRARLLKSMEKWSTCSDFALSKGEAIFENDLTKNVQHPPTCLEQFIASWAAESVRVQGKQ